MNDDYNDSLSYTIKILKNRVLEDPISNFNDFKIIDKYDEYFKFIDDKRKFRKKKIVNLPKHLFEI